MHDESDDMLEATHTPGPWEAGECGGWQVMAGPLEVNKPGYLKGGRGTVAEMSDEDFDEDEQEANARLIAAAPDMKRVAMALMTRAAEVGTTFAVERTADEVAYMDVSVVVPASIIRDALAALRKAGVIP